MDWVGLTEEQTLLCREISGFARKEIAPHLADFIKSKSSIEGVVKKLAALGLCGIMVPEPLGGAGMDLNCLLVSLLELARVLPSAALGVAAHNVAGFCIAQHAAEALKGELAPCLASGTVLAGMSLTGAVLNGEGESDKGLHLTGEVPFFINGAFCHCGLVTLEANGATMLAVIGDLSKQGFSGHDGVLGFQSSGLGSFRFDDYALSSGQVLSEKSVAQCQYLLHHCLAAIAIGISQGCLDHALPYAKERQQFSRPIVEFGMVQRLLAHICTCASAHRTALYNAAEAFEKSGECDENALRVFSFMRHQAMTAADYAVQLFGGCGYTKEYPVEMLFRDAKSLETVPPTFIELQFSCEG